MSKKNCLYFIRRKCQVFANTLMSNEFMSKVYFKIVLGYKLNLDNPKSLNEKLQWLKLYEWPNNEKAIKCADKFLVQNYVASIGKKEILNDILFSWDNANEINWKKLPNKFVLKCNHGCGYNIICKNKKELKEKDVKNQLDKWMKEDFSKFNVEPHYSKIPRKIICEKYLGDDIINYNIYCFNGKVVFFSVAGGLGNGIGEHLTYYNADGSIADFKNRSYPTNENKITPLLKKMKETAEFLAKDFPMVRVDLFDVKGKIILSEMTFTPGGALIPIEPVEKDFELGKKLDIEKLIKGKQNGKKNKK